MLVTTSIEAVNAMELAHITKRLFYIRSFQVFVELMLEAGKVSACEGGVRFQKSNFVVVFRACLAMLPENPWFEVYLIPLLPALFLSH